MVKQTKTATKTNRQEEIDLSKEEVAEEQKSEEIPTDGGHSTTDSDSLLSAPAPPIGLLMKDDEEDDEGDLDDGDDGLNEVEDAPKAILIEEDEDEDAPPASNIIDQLDEDDEEEELKQAVELNDDRDTNLISTDHLTLDGLSGSESEHELNDDPHCYCRLPWDGDEKMIECDECAIWYHFDCMGIPQSKVFAQDEPWLCDACRIKHGETPYPSPTTRRNRRKELEKSQQRAARRARARLEKKQGLTKAERAAKRSKERAARRKEREVNQQRQSKEATAGGLKHLLASFDDDDDSDSSDSSDDSSDDSSSEEEAASASNTSAKSKSSATAPSKPTQKVTPAKSKTKPTPSTPTSASKPSTGSNLTGKNMGGLFDSIRAKVRTSLEPILGNDLSRSVEDSLFQHFQSAGKSYLAQWRDIIANLKDPKNDLKKRVIMGLVTPAALAGMASKDLASSEMSKEREKIRADAVKNSVRAVSPPRDKSMVHHGKSLISAADDTPMSEAILNAIAGLQPKEELPRAPMLPKPKLPAAVPSQPKGPSTLLADLPQLGSYEEAIRSYQATDTTPKTSPKNGPTSTNAAATAAAEERRAKRRAVLAANAAAKKKAEMISSDEDETMKDVDTPPKTESVVEKKPMKTKEDAPTELLYQQLNLPPMDVWNGDLLLSAGANPSVLTNYFPLVAKQIAGPPIVTLPLPQRLEESLRLKLEEVQKYIQQVVARGSKKVVLVEFHLNTSATTTESTATLQQDYATFCQGYVKRARALAFDYQKDAEISHRLLLYLIPPDSTTFLTSEFVKKYLKVARPAGRMWGICILPKETYQPIAKRISKINLQKMLAQVAAAEKQQAAQPTPIVTSTVAAPSVPTVKPVDPRRPVAAVTSPPPVASDPAPTTAASTTSTSSSTATPSTDLASLLKSNPASLNALSSLLSRLVDKTGAGATAAPSLTSPSHANAVGGSSHFPPPPSPAAAVVPTFPPPPSTIPSFPPPSLPPPPPPQPVVSFPPPHQQQVAHPSYGLQPPSPQHAHPPPQQHMIPPPQPMNQFGGYPHPPPPPQGGYGQQPQQHFSPPQQPYQPPHQLPPPPMQLHQPNPQQSHLPPPPSPQSMLGKHGRDDQDPYQQHMNGPPARRSRFGPDKHTSVPLPVPNSMPLPPPPPPHVQMNIPNQPPAVGVCDFYFSPRGCVKDRCKYSHDLTTPGAQAIMRLKGIQPHIQAALDQLHREQAGMSGGGLSMSMPPQHQTPHPQFHGGPHPSMSLPPPPPPHFNGQQQFQPHMNAAGGPPFQHQSHMAMQQQPFQPPQLPPHQQLPPPPFH